MQLLLATELSVCQEVQIHGQTDRQTDTFLALYSTIVCSR